MSFLFIPRLVTLNDIEPRYGPLWPFCGVFFRRKKYISEPTKSNRLKLNAHFLRRKCSPKALVFDDRPIIVYGDILGACPARVR